MDTERLVDDACRAVIARHSDTPYTAQVAALGRGKRPLEACQAVIDALALPVSAPALLEETSHALDGKWGDAELLPGAVRLIQHLTKSGVPLALCTSTSRPQLAAKTNKLGELLGLFSVVVCGDDCTLGKPDAEPYRRACELLNVSPTACLAVEDAISGVLSARAAGCQVLAVPSLPDRKAYAGDRTEVLHNLLDVRLETYGLPPFQDWVARTLPLEPPLRFGGPVIRGFGRGSAMLVRKTAQGNDGAHTAQGIPTANLDVSAFPELAHAACTGIYSAFASVGERLADGSLPPVHLAAVSVGWNPVFKGEVKTLEPWILHSFAEAFYGQTLRLVLVAYIRPEADFTTLEALIKQIHDDGDVTRAALSLSMYDAHRHDPFLQPS